VTALVAALVLLAGIAALVLRDGGPSLRSATLIDGGGDPVGEVFIYDGTPSWVFVRVEDAPTDETYEWQVESADGETSEPREADWIEDGSGSWGRTTEADVEDLRFVRLLGDGGWHCEATFE
jgi:hypothetical protein